MKCIAEIEKREEAEQVGLTCVSPLMSTVSSSDRWRLVWKDRSDDTHFVSLAQNQTKAATDIRPQWRKLGLGAGRGKLFRLA